MRFIPITDERTPTDVEGIVSWDELVRKAEVQLGGPNYSTGEERRQHQSEIDARLDILPVDTRFVLAGIAEAIRNQQR